LEYKEFTVCSRTLARTSPVFERMLYGRFSEGKHSAGSCAEGWIVRLPEDKPAPMHVFLSILHGQLDRMPTDLSVDELYDLTMLLHYYDATSVLRPWVKICVDHLAHAVKDVDAREKKILCVDFQ
jgi:hypothetical protein